MESLNKALQSYTPSSLKTENFKIHICHRQKGEIVTSLIPDAARH